MPWNWKQPAWPNFTWRPERLRLAEEAFARASGQFLGTVTHLPHDDRDRLAVEAMTSEALTTSEIEGEVLNRASVQSSIQRELGLSADRRKVAPAEHGIGELMADLYRRFADPLDDQTLFRWHTMITRGRIDLRDIGRYRTQSRPMQVVSGSMHDPRVHFEAPLSRRVPTEMRRFIDTFNRGTPNGPEPLPAVTRAGIAHLHFECIHPFEDGNGRVGRAIAEKVLAQSLGQPTLTAIAGTILAHRAEYYRELETAGKRLEITQWLAWFAGIALEAQRRTLAQVEFLIDKARLLDRSRTELNDRQLAALVRVLREGPDGFTGGLSAGKYVAIAKTSPATATRDLSAMVDLGVLTRTGEHKHARYHSTIPRRPVPRITIDLDGRIVETPRARATD